MNDKQLKEIKKALSTILYLDAEMDNLSKETSKQIDIIYKKEASKQEVLAKKTDKFYKLLRKCDHKLDDKSLTKNQICTACGSYVPNVCKHCGK